MISILRPASYAFSQCQKPSAEKRSLQGLQKVLCRLKGKLRTEQGQQTRIFQDNERLKRTYEDKLRTDLGRAEEQKKDLQRAATEGKCNFTKLNVNCIFQGD